jgi:hypothetical protein
MDAKKRSLLQRIAIAAEHFLEEGAMWVAIGVAVGLAVLQIPGIHDIATAIGLDKDTQLRTAVFSLVLASVLYELRQVKRSVTPVIGRQHFATTRDMYKMLEEKAEAIVDPDRRSLDVLGLTLFIAWPELHLLLERPEMNEWKVRLAALAPGADASRLWVSADWPGESASMIKLVREFRDAEGKRRGHQIDIHEYEFSPAVHGFSLGNGDLFISTLRWQEGGLLSKSDFAYDYVPGNDTSPWAAAMRLLFNNWFERAIGPDAEERAQAEDEAGESEAQPAV